MLDFLNIDLIENFLPYMSKPERYNAEEHQTAKAQVNNNITADKPTCQNGTPNGKRAIIAKGEVNGICESHKAT